MKNFIIISSDIQQLKGVGTEWLLDRQGNLICKFYNGTIIRSVVGNEDATLSCGETLEVA